MRDARRPGCLSTHASTSFCLNFQRRPTLKPGRSSRLMSLYTVSRLTPRIAATSSTESSGSIMRAPCEARLPAWQSGPGRFDPSQPILLDKSRRCRAESVRVFHAPDFMQPTDRKASRRSHAGVRTPGQAASAGSAAVAACSAAMISAAVFWMRSREAASVSALPSKSWM